MPRRGSPTDDDPERENRTQTRASRPAADVEQSTDTVARAPNPLPRGKPAAKRPVDDPERENRTQARARRPAAKPEAPPEDYRTSSGYGLDEAASDYHTSRGYEAFEGDGDAEGEGVDDAGDPSLSLEGDGLDALDPELGSNTRAIPALGRDDAADEGEAEDEDDGNATHAGPPIKLEIVAGPDAGKKRRFKGVRMTIGRTPGVDFQLSDQSVSRRHVELVHGDEGVVLRDLGSGNGTRVNGTRTAEKVLEHGDEITIGKTTIRFVDEVAAFQKAREAAEKREAEEKARAEAEASGAAPSGDDGGGADAGGDEAGDGQPDGAEGAPAAIARAGRAPVRSRARDAARLSPLERFKALDVKLRLALVGGLVVLLLLVGLALKSRPPPPPPVDPAQVLATQKMQEARNAVREGDYATAVTLAEEAEKLVPGIDRTRLASNAREELAFIRALDEARTLLEANRFEDARKALARAEKGSARSQDLKIKVVRDLDAAELTYKKAKLQEFITAGELDAAKALLAELPVEDQAAPAQAIREFEDNLAREEAEEAAQARAQAANAAGARKARREEEIADAFRVVERKFAGGEWARASSECARVIDAYRGDRDITARARKLQGDIPNFGRNYEEGVKKYKQGAIVQAARPLRQAWALYRRIDLRANTYGQELKEKLGAASVAAGREALLRNDIAGAYTNFKNAVDFDSSDSKAREGLERVQAKADDLYQEAYMVRDRDPREALRKFKIVADVTDPGSTIHEKAKNQIAAMQP